MCVGIYTHTNICEYIHIHTYVFVYIQDVYTYIYTHICTWIHENIHICMCVYKHTHILKTRRITHKHYSNYVQLVGL